MSDSDLLLKKFQKELSSGTVSLVLLSVLARSNAPMYGYQIAKTLQSQNAPDDDARTGESIFAGKQSALYPVLRNLDDQGLLRSEIEPSVAGPPRRYYQITELGLDVLRRWTATWQQTRELVDHILQGPLS
jgi:PadR family transcriptional regulator, regulatory protein PadR